MEQKAFVKLLLDETGELIGAEKDGVFYPAEDVPQHRVPPMIKENWNLRLMKIWHRNPPCCANIGNKLVCWPPCV